MTHILISHVEQKAETALDLSKAIETKRSPIISGVMLPGSEKVLLALQDHSLEIWDVRKGRREKLFSENIVHPSDIWLNDLTVSADGVYAVLSWDQEMCEVWNLATGEYTEIVPHRYQVFSAVVDPDSKQLLSVGDEAGIVRFRDLQKNECTAAVTVAEKYGSWLDKLVLLPNDRFLFGSWNHTMGIRDISTGCLQDRLVGHSGHISCVSVDKENMRVLSGSVDTNLRLWNLSDGTCIHKMEGHDDTIKSVAIGSNGELAASLDVNGTLGFWNLLTGEHLGFATTKADLVDFVNRGKEILLANENDLAVYRVCC